jgi:hypothetical protein
MVTRSGTVIETRARGIDLEGERDLTHGAQKNDLVGGNNC